jgi:exosome complex RNA-binding protein Rrp4
MGMQEIKRKFVVPGDRIAEGNFRPLMNVIKVNNTIIATRIGIAEAGRDGIKVIPLSGVYIPRVNDIVIGKITDHSSLSWEVDINSCFSGHLPAQDVFGRDFSPARDDMGRQLAIGDLIPGQGSRKDPSWRIFKNFCNTCSTSDWKARFYDTNNRTSNTNKSFNWAKWDCCRYR